MYVLSIKVPIRKKSGNLSYAPRTLLSTQHYKVRIKGKVESSKERSSTLPLHFGVVAIEKGTLGSPLTLLFTC